MFCEKETFLVGSLLSEYVQMSAIYERRKATATPFLLLLPYHILQNYHPLIL